MVPVVPADVVPVDRADVVPVAPADVAPVVPARVVLAVRVGAAAGVVRVDRGVTAVISRTCRKMSSTSTGSPRWSRVVDASASAPS